MREETMPIPSDHARRHFLKRTALAAAGASVATMLPSAATPTNRDKPSVPPANCPDVKIPLKDVKGKVAFITGGSSGIGLGIARAFTDAGMKVVIGYRTKSHLDDAMKYLRNAHDRLHAIRVDVTDRPGMEKAAAEAVQFFGKVHVLVNNAGVALDPSLSATSYQLWDWTLNVNLNGPFNGVHAFLPLIQSHGEGGQIITTSSVMGLWALGFGAAYTVSKFAVVGMMEALRAELAESNVGASVFCPGLVNSNILKSSLRERPANSGVKDDEALLEKDRRIRNDPELAMDPLEVGRLVLRGMRNNDLYIFTHPEYERIMQDRNEALIASIPQDLHPTEKRLANARSALRTSIYSVERDRKLCAQAARGKANR